MARLNPRSTSTESRGIRLSSTPDAEQQHSSRPTSPAASATSDKENRASRGSTAKKRKSVNIEMPTSAPEASASAKRRRVNGGEQNQSQIGRRRVLDDKGKQYYDPEQNPDVRRKIKKQLRTLTSDLNDNKTEYLQADNRGLINTLTQANQLFEDVKQTSDATIDSRLLVTTADLSYRKVRTLTLGDSAVGVDVDDFVTKCIAFMKRGESTGTRGDTSASTQTQRRRRQQVEDDEENDNGEWMNWDYLGRNACFLYNSRPCLSGFLLGPLSVQKKSRQQTQRRARQTQTDPSQQLRPLELQQEDLEKQESASLAVICTEINSLLQRHLTKALAALEAEYDELESEPPDEEVHKMMYSHGLGTDGGVPLFKFCINPHSFGQSIENMFYVSFLIKEGRVGLNFDGLGFPTLHPAAEKSVKERQETQRNQAVFTMSFEVWEDVVKSFGIMESIIPNRKEGDYVDEPVAPPVQNQETERESDGASTRGHEQTEAGNAGLPARTANRRAQRESSDMYG